MDWRISKRLVTIEFYNFGLQLGQEQQSNGQNARFDQNQLKCTAV